MELEIHNTGFINSPTTHLFPLAVQLGSRGVSSMINFELKTQNNEKYYKTKPYYMSILKQNRKNGKMQKNETDADPPCGDGDRARKSLIKRYFLLLLLVKIPKI